MNTSIMIEQPTRLRRHLERVGFRSVDHVVPASGVSEEVRRLIEDRRTSAVRISDEEGRTVLFFPVNETPLDARLWAAVAAVGDTVPHCSVEVDPG